MMKRPIIVAIASVSGGGKTSVTNMLVNQIPNSKAVYFDDYHFIGPEHIVDWVDRGADCNEWELTPLLLDIDLLSKDTELDIILIDYPFSRLHNALTNIDITIFIDTPLDVALARRLIRDYSDRETTHIIEDVKYYLKDGRRAYQSMLNTVRTNSDYLIDGTVSIHEITDEIIEIIRGE